MKIRSMFGLLLAVVLAIALTSCSGSNGVAEGDRVKPYDRDGMLGITNSNPNLPTSPTYHTYGKDRKLVEETLSHFPEITNPLISFNGPHLTVRYSEPDGYSAEQSRQLKEDLAAALRYMLPRYEIHLKSNRGR